MLGVTPLFATPNHPSYPAAHGVGIATEADIEKTCKFSAKWALAARKGPEKALGCPLRRRDIPLDGDSDDPAYRLL
jgi:hypothetical protein